MILVLVGGWRALFDFAALLARPPSNSSSQTLDILHLLTSRVQAIAPEVLEESVLISQIDEGAALYLVRRLSPRRRAQHDLSEGRFYPCEI